MYYHYKCLEESCSPDRSKVLSVVPIFKNIGEQSTAEDYCPVSLLSVVGEALATEMWPFL